MQATQPPTNRGDLSQDLQPDCVPRMFSLMLLRKVCGMRTVIYAA
jgi:hypothetical protein